jgi:hypothetical protein
MINEDALWYKRGTLVEFTLHLGGGAKKCRGLVLNTAVLFGRGARQIWIVDMDDATPQQESAWKGKKCIVHEEEIISQVSSVYIGSEVILEDNPVSYPVRDGAQEFEAPTVTVTVALPMVERERQDASDAQKAAEGKTTP